MNGESGQIQNIILENRGKLTVTGVKDILTFDEESIILDTQNGILEILGSDLKVESLSLETGEIIAGGTINSLNYAGEKNRSGSFLKNIFK